MGVHLDQIVPWGPWAMEMWKKTNDIMIYR
jgi:hypothetical protein